MPEQLIVGFNPMPAANRVAYFARQVRSRLLWLLVAVAICVWIWIWQRRSLSVQDTGWLFGLGIVYSGIWLVVAMVGWRRAKSALAKITPGVAVAVDRRGIWLQGATMGWSEINQVALRAGRFGSSPVMEVRPVAGLPARISVADLDVMPGSIDAAIRAYSAGTHQLDTSRLGN